MVCDRWGHHPTGEQRGPAWGSEVRSALADDGGFVGRGVAEIVIAKPGVEGVWGSQGMRGGWWTVGSIPTGCHKGSSTQLLWGLEVSDRGQRQEVTWSVPPVKTDSQETMF